MVSNQIEITVDGIAVLADPDETLGHVCRRIGHPLPHLCQPIQPGYTAHGICRSCLVEVEGERHLVASCVRHPEPGMVVHSQSERARKNRKLVLELLLADQPAEAHDADSDLFHMAKSVGLTESRFPKRDAPIPPSDFSHPAIGVQLDACIHCRLCVQACQDVQVNRVIGIAHRGPYATVSFDLADPMGESRCVGCGECVQICPTGALMPANLLDARGRGDRSQVPPSARTVCPFCGVGCQITLHAKDDEIAYVNGADGPANQKRLCIKGRFGFDYVRHPHRLTTPLIRKPDAPKELAVDPANPYTHFRKATWEEALQFAADGFKRVQQKHGNEAIAGFGSAKGLNEDAYLFQKLIRQAFGHNHMDHCSRLCHASSVAALMHDIGAASVTASFNQVANADVVIVIGCNPVENHPVAGTFFKQYVEQGGTLIAIDPRRTGLAEIATVHLPFRPGTDVALLSAMMKVIVDEGLYNQDFIAQHTEGWEALTQQLNHINVEHVAKLCGLEVVDIINAAQRFAAAEAGMIFWGMGITQHVHGTDNVHALVSLALMCGHIGRPGTGLHPLRGQNNVQGAGDMGLVPNYLPDYRPVSDDKARKSVEKVWGKVGAPLNSVPGKTMTDIMHGIQEGLFHCLYIQGENPAMSDPDLNHARAALAKLEHLVVQDIFVTETANFADVILPSAAFAEKNGTVTNTNRQIQRVRPGLNPPGEAKADWWIMQQLAQRMGLDWKYETPEQIYAEMQKVIPRLTHIGWARLEQENAVTYPCDDDHSAGQDVIFTDHVFYTDNGKAKFTPVFPLPPAELPSDEYPLILTTGRILEQWHTGAMTRRSKVLSDVAPDPVCTLHPRTLNKLGIPPGNPIKLSTRRGSITLIAEADPGVAPNMVFLPFAFEEAAANLLTNPACDPEAKIPELKYAAVRVERIL